MILIFLLSALNGLRFFLTIINYNYIYVIRYIKSLTQGLVLYSYFWLFLNTRLFYNMSIFAFQQDAIYQYMHIVYLVCLHIFLSDLLKLLFVLNLDS